MPTPRAKKKPAARAEYEDNHYSVHWDTDGGYRPMTLDARSLTLPSVAVLGVIASFVWGTYMIVGERTRIDNRIDKTIVAIERLADVVDGSIRATELRTMERFTKTDHDLFCAQAERLNPSWKCPAGFGNVRPLTKLPTPEIEGTPAKETIKKVLER